MKFTEQDKKTLNVYQEALRFTDKPETKQKLKDIIDNFLIDKSGLVDDWIKDDPDFNYYENDFGNYCENVCIQKSESFMQSYVNTILYDMSVRLKNAGYLYSYTHVDDNGKKCVKTILEKHPYQELYFYTSKEVDDFIMRNPITTPF